MDLSGGGQEYWNEPGGNLNYTGGFDMTLIHKLTPRMSIAVIASAVYQDTPNFALVNAPTTSGNNGSYLNGNLAVNLSYNWTARVSTVTTYSLGFNLLQAGGADDLYQNTLGTQFRYTVSPRNTLTAELRGTEAVYPTNSAANNSEVYYLLGLDTNLTSRISNTFSTGIETASTQSGVLQPYFEGETTLALRHGSSLTWSNTYGTQQSPNVGQSSVSYRTGLSYGQPLSTKLSASIGISYNNVKTTDTQDPAANNTQNQFEISASLGYTLSPRFSLSLSYSYLDLLSSAINSSYMRDQIYLGGSYTFR
jgi:hypothetical protein